MFQFHATTVTVSLYTRGGFTLTCYSYDELGMLLINDLTLRFAGFPGVTAMGAIHRSTCHDMDINANYVAY